MGLNTGRGITTKELEQYAEVEKGWKHDNRTIKILKMWQRFSSTVYAQTMPTQTQDRLPVPISTIRNLLLRFFHKNVDRLNSNSLRTKSL